jgi:hypothetical protein
MDRLWHENRWPWIEEQTKPVFLRRQSVKNVDCSTAPAVSLFDGNHVSTTLSDSIGQLHGTHSGFCALNLAYQMRPTALYLIGFDMARGPRGEAHWFPQYPWVIKAHATSIGRFDEWARQFDTAAQQLLDAGISVFIASGVRHKLFKRIGKQKLEEDAACCD